MMRFLKMKWVKVSGLVLVGLLPAVLIYVFDSSPWAESENDFLKGYPRAVMSERILYSEEVVLGSLYYNQYMLEDGRRIEVQIWDWEGPEIFKKNQKVLLCYSTAGGMRITDPVSRAYRQVSLIWENDKSGPPTHLIDLIFKRSTKIYDSPINEAMVFYDALPLWQCEINRMENFILTAKNTPDEIREQVLGMRKLRTQYLNRFYCLTEGATNFSMSKGNGHWESMDSIMFNYRAYRDFAMQLCIMGQYLNNYNYPGADEQRRLLEQEYAQEMAGPADQKL